MSVDELIEQINSLNTEYCEYTELENNVNLKLHNYKEIELTRERYKRYLKHIKIWNIEELNINAWYIKDLIVEFINGTNNINETNKSKYLKIMKKIDFELKKIVDITNDK